MPATDRIRVAAGTIRPKAREHVTVFFEKDIFAGHPFNAGFNQFGDGDEMVVCYGTRRCTVKTRPDGSKAYPMEATSHSGRSRSTDGGKTWVEDVPFTFNAGGSPECLSADQARDLGAVPTRPIDPFNRDHGLQFRSDHVYTTLDRGKTWTGPSFLPHDGLTSFWNRPAYLIRTDGVILTFPTVDRRNRTEGRLFTYASYDGGVTWAQLGLMAQNDDYMLIMPTAVNLPSGRLLAAVRVHITGYAAWTEMYDSADGGCTWRFIGRLNDHGMPCQLATLRDGRLVAFYGYRQPPYGARARVSEDAEGWRWGPEIILRDDGYSLDLGYPRGGVAADGTVVAIYYYHDKRYPRPADCTQFHWGTRSCEATRFTV